MANGLIDQTVCLLLHFSRPGITRKLDKDQFEAQDADKELVRASRKIIDSPEYKAVVSYELHVKHFLKSLALPSKLYRDGTYLITRARMDGVDKFLAEAKPEWKERVEAYIATYDDRLRETAERLGKLASDDDRMSAEELRANFGFDHSFVTLQTPTTLKEVSAALFEREEARMKERLRSAEDDIKAAYRAQFHEMVNGMRSMLSGAKTEKGNAMKFTGVRIERMRTFIEQFTNEQNVCGDTELSKVMLEASKLLQGVDTKELRDDAKWRAAMDEAFLNLGNELAVMTKPKGKRSIEFDEEVVEA